MAEAINYSFGIVIPGGPRVTYGAQLEVKAYDVLEFQVPKDSGTATVAAVPGSSDVKLLLITAASYDGLKYSVDGGTTEHYLEAPLLLIGEGAVELLDALPAEFLFTNEAGQENTVNILVGRDPTP